jgi:hypothetical protein
MEREQGNLNASNCVKKDSALISDFKKLQDLVAGCFSVAMMLESADNDVVKRWEENGTLNVVSNAARLLQRQLGEAWRLACDIGDEMTRA